MQDTLVLRNIIHMRIFGFLMLLCYFGMNAFAYEPNSSAENDILIRMQMVREAKILTKEYRLLENKMKSWQEHKDKLIREFHRKNMAMQNLGLGNDNNYIYIRAQKRKKEFYQSLANKERQITTRLMNVSKKLSDLKNQFLFKFAVPLTEEEMFKNRRPKLQDKDKKLQMLGTYIDYRHTYESFRKQNQQFDQVKELMASIPKVNQKEIDFDQNMTIQSQENRNKMYEYKMLSDKLAEEFYNKYGVYIENEQKAKEFMDNINKYATSY